MTGQPRRSFHLIRIKQSCHAEINPADSVETHSAQSGRPQPATRTNPVASALRLPPLLCNVRNPAKDSMSARLRSSSMESPSLAAPDGDPPLRRPRPAGIPKSTHSGASHGQPAPPPADRAAARLARGAARSGPGASGPALHARVCRPRPRPKPNPGAIDSIAMTTGSFARLVEEGGRQWRPI